MISQDRTIQNMLNPGFGAVVLKAFVDEYYHQKATEGVPVLALFMVLPIVLKGDLRDVLCQKRSFKRLSILLDDFADAKVSHLLDTLNSTSLSLRNLTLESISMAAATSLFRCDFKEGVVYPTDSKADLSSIASGELNSALKAAKNLGALATKQSLYEFASVFKVRF